MRMIFTLLMLLVLDKVSYAQNLTGTWEGEFTADSSFCFPFPVKIYLHLKQREDSVITGFSTTCIIRSGYFVNGISKGPVRVDTTICIVKGSANNNKIELEEIDNYKKLTSNNSDFQQMTLTYKARNRSITMKGRWTSDDSACGKGNIKFKKID